MSIEIADPEGMKTITQHVFENYQEYQRLAYEQHGFAGVIELGERLAKAARDYGLGTGTSTDEVVVQLMGHVLPQFDRELYPRVA